MRRRRKIFKIFQEKDELNHLYDQSGSEKTGIKRTLKPQKHLLLQLKL